MALALTLDYGLSTPDLGQSCLLRLSSLVI